MAWLLMIPWCFSGCDTLPDEQPSRGASLSDAMRASAAGDRSDIGGHSIDGHSSSRYFADTPDATAPATGGVPAAGFVPVLGADAGSIAEITEYDWQTLADASYAVPINTQRQSLTHFTLTPFATVDEQNMIGIYVGGAAVQLKSGSQADQAVNDVWMFEAGFTFRRYLNNSHTALSPYLTTSLGFAMLNWSYRSPVTSGGETFDGDSLYGGEGSVAIGVSTRRDYRWGAFAEAGVGGTVFAPTTVNGFDNDFFHNFGFLSVKVGVSLKF